MEKIAKKKSLCYNNFTSKREGKNTNEKTDDSRKIWTVYIFLVWYDRFFEHGKPMHPAMNARQVM